MKCRFLGIRQLLKCPERVEKSNFISKCKLFYSTFFYNEFASSYLVADTLLNPMFWFVDNFVHYFGFIFVILVWTLVSNMIFVFYYCIIPVLYENASSFKFLFHFIIGNWLAINTVFHYYMGWRTRPGYPPNTKFDNVVSICKKCLSGKPPRTHHCSICNKCVLGMDHHCPWFNNCIGHFNHRYFYMFCVFMTIDCFYLATVGFHYYQLHAYPNMDLKIYELFFHQLLPETEAGAPGNTIFHKIATVEFFIAFIAGFALLILASINGFLISIGATNVELKSLRITCYGTNITDHPYNIGFTNNWKYFLGCNNLSSFVYRVLLPSRHKPHGDGIYWKEYTELHEKVYSRLHKTFEIV